MLKKFFPLIALTLVAQAPTPTPPSPMSPKPFAMPGKAAAMAPEPQEGEVIAYLGKKKITYGDFTKWLKVMAGPRAEMIRKNPANRAQVQKQYLELQVLAAKGRKDKLQTTPEFKAFLAALEQQCYARVLLDEDRPGSPGQKLKEKAENPTEDEVRAYFTGQQRAVRHPGEVHRPPHPGGPQGHARRARASPRRRPRPRSPRSRRN